MFDVLQTHLTPATLQEQLRRLVPDQISALALSLRTSARSAAQSAIEIYLTDDDEVGDKAQRLLGELDEVAIVPLLESARPVSAEKRSWMILQSVEAELALRRRIIAQLDKLLDDRELLPVKSRGPIEQSVPARRICDQAYLLMRKIVHIGEAQEEASVQENLFLNAPDDFKDAQIEKARHCAIWNRAITGQDIEDYAATDKDPPGHRSGR